MTPAPTDTTTITAGAADTAASAASGAEADAAIAAKVTADAAEAAKTPEQKAADQKAIVDKQIADAVAAEALKYKAPEKYEGLKLPDGSPVDPTVVERTAAIARELGLSQTNAQKALGFVASEAAREVAAQLSAYAPPSEQHPEGGAKWKEQDTAWKAAALVDKDLGNGKPEQLEAARVLATKVLAKFGDEESINFVDSALGSSPALLRVLVRIGKAMGEPALVKPVGDRNASERLADKDVFYPKGAGRSEEQIRAEAS